MILCYVSLPSPLLSSVFCVELPTISKSWYSGSILFARLLSYATGAKEFSLKDLQGIKIRLQCSPFITHFIITCIIFCFYEA